jgi:hypothetical protein
MRVIYADLNLGILRRGRGFERCILMFSRPQSLDSRFRNHGRHHYAGCAAGKMPCLGHT